MRAVARIICPLRTMQPHPQSVVMVVPSMGGKLVRYVIHTRELKSSKKRRMCGGAPSMSLLETTTEEGERKGRKVT